MSTKLSSNATTTCTTQQRQQIKLIASVVRALITSRKQPCPLKDILREYPEVESKPINYKQFGYKTVEDLLRETGEFTFNRICGETCIAVKYSGKSAHITSLVRQQKSSKTTSKRAHVRQPKRSDQSWNKSSYSSNVYQKLPAAAKSVNRFLLSQSRQNDCNNNNKPSSNRHNNTMQQHQYQRSQQSTNGGGGGSGGVGGSSSSSAGQKDLRNLLNTKMHQQQQSTNSNQKMTSLTNGGSGGGKSSFDLRDRLNVKHQQQSTQQQQQPQKYQTQQQNFNIKHNGPRAILGQNNNNNENGTTNLISQALNEQIMQNNSAIAIASSLILYQRQQQQEKLCWQQQNQMLQQQQQQQLMLQRMQQQQPQQQQQQQHQQKYQHQYPIQTLQKQSSPPPPPPVVSQKQWQQKLGTSSSVQDRLKIKINNSNNHNNNNTFNTKNSPGGTPEISPALSSAGTEYHYPSPFGGGGAVACPRVAESDDCQKIIPPKVFQFNPELDPITSLSQYCVVRRCAQPAYTFLKSKFSKLFQCRVLINGSIYSTYPNEYPNEHTAKYALAQQAIEQIKVQESRRHLPLCTDSDYDLSMKIFEELQSHPHGLFAKNVPEWFENTFEQSLPDHWWTVVQGSNKFITETTTTSDIIIFANLITEKTDDSTTTTTDQTDGAGHSDSLENAAATITQLESIRLPWTEKYWELYITHCISTVEIWGRLFGKDYSEKLDNLMNDIDVYMLTEKTRPTSVVCKKIYLTCIFECWHRVRLEDVDKLNGIGLCFFVDFGDEDWLPISQLYICENQFLKLPSQAVPFSLFGLEDFAGNPNAKRHLDGMLASKSVVGEILSKEECFLAAAGDNGDNGGAGAGAEVGANGKIQVVLYDTSSQDDVNLNPLILNQICDDTPPPEIKSKGLTNVLISYVTDSGDLFLQVRNSELLYVQKLLQQLIESKFKKDQHKVTKDDMKRSNMFLIFDDNDNEKCTEGNNHSLTATGQWYRGALSVDSQFKPDDEEFDIFYVDYGIKKRISISNIFRLESLSTALSKFPRQAIKAKLHNIPPITEEIVGRMRALLPTNSRALVKMGTQSQIPLVVIYRRLTGSEALCNVNEVIRIEQELESSSDLLAPEEEDAQSATLPDTTQHVTALSSHISPSNSSPSPRRGSIIDLTQSTRKLSIKSVPNSPQKIADLPQLKSYDALPGVGEYFDVRVTMSADPSNFTIQPYKDFPKLRDLMKSLQTYCETNDEFIPADMVKIGEAYAAKNADGFYHRVIVVNTYSGNIIHVCFCDFGDVAIVRSDQLKTLPVKFRELPRQAIQAKLYGASPLYVDWTVEDCLRFRELTVGRKFVSIIKQISCDKVNQLDTRFFELDLIDVETDEDIYIREILLKEGRAINKDIS